MHSPIEDKYHMGDVLLVIGFSITVLSAMKSGYINSPLAGAILLIGIVLLVAMRHSIIAKVFLVGVAFVYLLVQFNIFNLQGAINTAIALLPLLIMLLGFYIMFRGPLGSKRK